MTRRNLVKIKDSFATLLKDVAVKLKTKELDLEAFRFFIVALFPPGKCIPQSTNIITIFEAVTQNELWSYWHYTPVEKIVMEYAPHDDEMKGWLDNYKKELSGYKATTKIADVIELYSIDEEANPGKPLSLKYDGEYLHQLTMKLKTPVSEKTLLYVDDLWLSLAEYFLLPSLSVLLDSIKKGCVEVSWLVPPHLVFQIIGNLRENSMLLQSKGIVKMLLDGECAYDGAQDDEFRQVQMILCLLELIIMFLPLQRLVDAVSNGNIDEIVVLLTTEIDINITLEVFLVPHNNGLTAVVSMLLDYGAEIDMRNKAGFSNTTLLCVS